MRYLTVVAKPNGRSAFHPLGGQLTEEPTIRRRAIHHIELLDDGTILLLAEASGNRQRYDEIMENSPFVIEHLTAGEDCWMAVSRSEPTEPVRRALELQRDSSVVVDTPMSFTSSGHLKITYLGTDESFRRLYNLVDEMESITVEVLSTGEYEASNSSFGTLLTARQEAVLEAAVDVGYYREPRQASLADVGEAVGISSATAGEHLRKVEERVFSEIVR